MTTGLCKYLGHHQDGHLIDIPVSTFVIALLANFFLDPERQIISFHPFS